MQTWEEYIKANILNFREEYKKLPEEIRTIIEKDKYAKNLFRK